MRSKVGLSDLKLTSWPQIVSILSSSRLLSCLMLDCMFCLGHSDVQAFLRDTNRRVVLKLQIISQLLNHDPRSQ